MFKPKYLVVRTRKYESIGQTHIDTHAFWRLRDAKAYCLEYPEQCEIRIWNGRDWVAI